MAEKFLIKKAEIFGKGFQLFYCYGIEFLKSCLGVILGVGQGSFPKTFEMPRPAPVCVF